MSGLRAARELAGLSQTELARRMAAAGFNWSQMTVSRREENDNTLRWNEGVALRSLIHWPLLDSNRTDDYRAVLVAQIQALQFELALLADAEWKGQS